MIQLGSFQKVVNYYTDHGILNTRGNPLKIESIRPKVFNWIVLNPKKSLAMLREKYPDISDEYWEQFLVVKAHNYFVKQKHNRMIFLNWLKKHGLEKYSDFRRSEHFKS